VSTALCFCFGFLCLCLCLCLSSCSCSFLFSFLFWFWFAAHTCLGCAAGADIKLFVHDADFDEEVAVTDLEQLSGSGSFADCEILPKDASGALLGPQELAEGGA